MNKLIVAFALSFFIATLLTSIIEGESQSMSTYLIATCDETATTVQVQDNEGFPTSGVITMNGEDIDYNIKNCTATGCTFGDLTRGINSTEAGYHVIGTSVYSPDSSALNKTLGFNVTQISTDAGVEMIPKLMWGFMVHSVPRFIMWDYPFLKEGHLTYLRYLLMCISCGLVAYLAITVVSALGGVMQSIVKRW